MSQAQNPVINESSDFTQEVFEVQRSLDQFEDPIAGFAVLFAGLDPEYAQSIGIH